MLNIRIVGIFAVMSVAVARQLDHACEDNSTCMARCEQTGATGCESLRCDSAFKHCACMGAAALLRDGSCTQAQEVPDVSEDSRRCISPAYSVLLTAAARATPDMKPADFSTGELNRSTSLATLLFRCLGAAVGRPTSDVWIFQASLTLYQKSLISLLSNSSIAPTLLFDMHFDFCVSGDANKTVSFPLLHPAEFEKRFGHEAMQYAAMFPSTVRILTFEHNATKTTEEEVIVPTAGHSRPIDSAEVGGSGSMFSSILTPSVFLVGAAVIAVALSICACRLYALVLERRGRHGTVKSFDDVTPRTNFTEPDVPEVDDAMTIKRKTGAVAVAYATYGFDAEKAAQEDVVWESCLSLSVGDLLEVHASSGQWLYGCHHGAQGPMGYFHETYVAWLGQALPRSFSEEIKARFYLAKERQPEGKSQSFPCSLPGEIPARIQSQNVVTPEGLEDIQV